MKYFLFSIYLFMLLIGQVVNAQNLYDVNNITSINMDFYDTNWETILDGYMSTGSDDRVLADVTINGVLYDSVGVKFKGNSSYTSGQTKNPFNIKLNYVKSQDYQGYYTLKLSNVFKDPSFVREVLAYEIANKYMPASLTAFANIYINGSLIGLYTNVQAVNDVFTKEHYYSEDRPFFEGTDVYGPPPGACFSGPPVAWAYMGTDSATCYSAYYDSKSGNDYIYIMNFLDTFNNYPASMEGMYNVDRHLWAIAFDIAFVNLDAPISMTHNFYVYYDASKRFNYIKWDMNECFGVFTRLGSGPGGTSLSITQMQQLDPFTGNSTDYPVMYYPWTQTRWKKMYIAHMQTIMEENIANNWYMTRAAQIQTIIDTAVQNDPNKFYTYSDFTNNLNNMVNTSIGISQLMAARNTYLNNTSYFQFTQPDISSINNTPSSATPLSNVTITATITNANYAYLGYRDEIGARFTKTEMFDDGLHNDGSAGDNVWGATIAVNNTNIEYYIYAENNDAGKFSPARAEYEFYTLSVVGDLVINEFMASNDITIADQNGEYNDWVELYNNSSNSINLNNYYLSDDMSNPYKWQFPDTSIAAGGYLIIWTDKDTLQTGLHSNFKLSAAGEAIILSNNSKSLLDQIAFSSQTTDITTGRYPNGTGNFIIMTPTYAAENTNTLYIPEQESDIPEIWIYPNPATETVNITINDYEKHLLSIYNISGQLIIQEYVTGKKTIDINYLNPGFYLLNIDGTISKKLIIQ